MKKLKYLIILVVVAGMALMLGMYHVVRTTDGVQLVKKKQFSYGEMVVDTRDWTPIDWLKNKDISLALSEANWNKLKDKVSSGWKDLEKSISDFDMKESSADAQKQLAKLRDTSKKKYDALSKRLEKKEITWDDFQDKLKELRAWTEKQVEAIKKKFA